MARLRNKRGLEMAYAVGMCRSLNIWDVAKNATSDRFPTGAVFATVRLG